MFEERRLKGHDFGSRFKRVNQYSRFPEFLTSCFNNWTAVSQIMKYQAMSVSHEITGKLLRPSPYYLTRELDERINRLALKGWFVVAMTTTLVKDRLVHVILFGKEDRRSNRATNESEERERH